MGCLAATCPILRTFIGGAAFRHTAAVHIRRNPPRARTLDAFPDNRDLRELAWIEWSLATAFVARACACLRLRMSKHCSSPAPQGAPARCARGSSTGPGLVWAWAGLVWSGLVWAGRRCCCR